MLWISPQWKHALAAADHTPMETRTQGCKSFPNGNTPSTPWILPQWKHALDAMDLTPMETRPLCSGFYLNGNTPSTLWMWVGNLFGSSGSHTCTSNPMFFALHQMQSSAAHAQNLLPLTLEYTGCKHAKERRNKLHDHMHSSLLCGVSGKHNIRLGKARLCGNCLSVYLLLTRV